MADLNKELNEYLLSSKNDKQFKISIPSVSIPKPSLGKWLGRSEGEPKEDTGWFKDSQKDCCPSMTRLQRLTAFALCTFMGILCFCLSAMYIPVLLLKARKFAMLYSLGSLFFLMRGPLSIKPSLCRPKPRALAAITKNAFLQISRKRFCFLWGPISYLRSLFTSERWCFTVSYFTTLIGTLYFALHLQSTPLTVLCAVLQLIAMLSFLVSHIPGGTTGLMFFTRMFKSSVSATLPV